MYQGVELSKIDPEVKKNSEIQSVFFVVVVFMFFGDFFFFLRRVDLLSCHLL